MIDFRSTVREAMARKGLNAKQLADQSEVGYASVHGFIRGDGGLTADNLAKVLTTLGVRVQLPKSGAR